MNGRLIPVNVIGRIDSDRACPRVAVVEPTAVAVRSPQQDAEVSLD